MGGGGAGAGADGEGEDMFGLGLAGAEGIDAMEEEYAEDENYGDEDYGDHAEVEDFGEDEEEKGGNMYED